MDKIEELRKSLELNDAPASDIETRFKEIAENLFNNLVIRTSQDDFRFEDIEFYFHSKQHPDYIAHPRNSAPLRWYINDFGGIDINFKSEASLENPKDPCSKYCWNEESYYGGILIRQIRRISDGLILNGPLKVAELFRDLGCATDGTCAMPQLVYVDGLYKIEFEACLRHNLVKDPKSDEECRKKLKTISSWYSKADLSDKIESYKEQVAHNCRFKRV